MRILIGEFDRQSLGYLQTISSGSPVKFTENPVVFMSAPVVEDIDHEDNHLIDVQFNSARMLFNSKRNMAELDIFLDIALPRTDLADFLVGPVPSFRPYFNWLDDPMRGMTSKNFCLSLVNTLSLDLKPLRISLRSVTSNDPVCQQFNAAILTVDQPDHKTSYGQYT